MAQQDNQTVEGGEGDEQRQQPQAQPQRPVGVDVELCHVAVGCNRVANAAAWGPSGLLAFGAHSAVAVTDRQVKRVLLTLPGDGHRINAVEWLPRHLVLPPGVQRPAEDVLLSGSAGGGLAVWSCNGSTGKWTQQQTIAAAHAKAINCIAGVLLPPSLQSADLLQHPQQQHEQEQQQQQQQQQVGLAATASADGTVAIWHVHVRGGKAADQQPFACSLTRTQVVAAGGGRAAEAVALVWVPSSCGVFMAVGGLSNHIQLFFRDLRQKGHPQQQQQPPQFVLVCELRGHQDWVRSLDFALPLAAAHASTASAASVRLGEVDGRTSGASPASADASCRERDDVNDGDDGTDARHGDLHASQLVCQVAPVRTGRGGAVSLLLASASQDRGVRVWRISASSTREEGRTVEGDTHSSRRNRDERGDDGVKDATEAEEGEGDEERDGLGLGGLRDVLGLKEYTVGPSFEAGGGTWAATMDSLLLAHEDWVHSVRWHPPVRMSTSAGASSASPAMSSTDTLPGSNVGQPLRLLSASMDRTLLMWKLEGAADVAIGDDMAQNLWVNDVSLGELGHSALGFYGGLWGPRGDAVVAHGFGGSLHLWRDKGRGKIDCGPPGGVHADDSCGGGGGGRLGAVEGVEGRQPLLEGRAAREEWSAECVPSGHFGAVVDACWDRSGNALLTVSHDQTSRIFAPWRTAERIGHEDADDAAQEDAVWREIARPQVHGHDLHCCAFVPCHGGKAIGEGKAGEEDKGGQAAAVGLAAAAAAAAARAAGGGGGMSRDGGDADGLTSISNSMPPELPNMLTYVSGAEEKVVRVFESPDTFLRTLEHSRATLLSKPEKACLPLGQNGLREKGGRESGAGEEGAEGEHGGFTRGKSGEVPAAQEMAEVSAAAAEVGATAAAAAAAAAASAPSEVAVAAPSRGERERRLVGASLPALGLSQKPIFIQDGGPADRADMDSNGLGLVGDGGAEWEAEFAAAPMALTSPPLEEHLQHSTLWPETLKLYGHGNDVVCCAADHSGHLVASACKAQSAEFADVWLWDAAASWKPCGRLRSHTLTVTQMEFSPCDTFLLTVSRDRHISVFRRRGPGQSTTGTEAQGSAPYSLLSRVEAAHKRIIWSCGWAPMATSGDVPVFATGARDKTVKIWAVHDPPASSSGTYEASHTDPANPADAADQQQQRPAPTSHGSQRSTVSAVATLPSFANAVTAVAWSPLVDPPSCSGTGNEGVRTSVLAVGLEDGRVELWEVQLRNFLKEEVGGCAGSVRSGQGGVQIEARARRLLVLAPEAQHVAAVHRLRWNHRWGGPGGGCVLAGEEASRGAEAMPSHPFERATGGSASSVWATCGVYRQHAASTSLEFREAVGVSSLGGRHEEGVGDSGGVVGCGVSFLLASCSADHSTRVVRVNLTNG